MPHRQEKEEPIVFIAEDDEMYSNLLADNIKKFFGPRPHKLYQFASGDECLRHLELEPDIVFLDYHMPGMNGLDTLKAIKEDNSRVLVIVLSTEHQIKVAEDTLKAEAYAYVIKDKVSFLRIK